MIQFPTPEDGWAKWYANKASTPTGNQHLHFIMRSKVGMWVVRSRASVCCKSGRCRRVVILEGEGEVEYEQVGDKLLALVAFARQEMV